MTLPFENDTGPVIKKLAARSIQTDKRRNLFVIVTIALAAALMAAIFCTGAGSDRKLGADLRGQYQAVVVNCDRDTIEKLKDCPLSIPNSHFPFPIKTALLSQWLPLSCGLLYI